jgi:hypothetical protein
MLRSLILASILGSSAVAAAQPGGSPPVPAPATSAGDQLVTITLRDGQLVRGRILAETESYLILRLVSGGEMAVAQGNIRAIKRNDQTVFVSDDNEIYKHDPNRTRYLYGPSAFMLRQGEGYFSQTELFMSTIGYGVTDHFTVTVGSFVPLLFVDEGQNVLLGAKVGASVSEHLHVAAGFHSLVIPDGGVVGIASGQLTLGTPRAHLTLSGGKPFVMSDGESELGDVMTSISGNVRISKHAALVSENWIFRDGDDTHVIASGAIRFMGEHSAVDVGFVGFPDAEVPIPWLDFTWNWD